TDLHAAGETADRKRGLPLSFQGRLIARLRRTARNTEHHARGAADIEPALVGGRLYRHALVLVVGVDGAHDIDGGQFATADGRDHVLDILLAESMQGRLEAFPREDLAGALESPLENAVAETGILLADRHARCPADRGARLSGDDNFLPGGRRHLHAGTDNLHLVAVVQPGDERHDAAVDLGADGRVADIGVDGIGEIDRRRTARQRDQLALRGETEDLVLEQFELGMLQELLRIVAFRKRLDRASEPRIGAGLLRQQFTTVAALPILVERVGGDPVFGDLVHPPGAKLQFDTLPGRTDDRGMDRAVIILLRRRDIILEAAGHDAPARMHDAERPVAGGDVADDDAETVD